MQLEKATVQNFEPSILPQAVTADATGSAVDTQGYNSATLFGFLDDSATGTFKVQEADTSGGSYTDVADAQCIKSGGVKANDATGVASDLVKIGVVNTKRYLKAVFTHSADGDIAAGFVLECPAVAPTGTN